MHRSAPSLVRVGYANHYNIRCIAAQCACSGSPSNWKRKFNAKPVVPQSSPTNQYHNPLTVTRICAIAIVWYSFVQLGADWVFGQPLLNYGLSGSVTIDEPPMHNCSVGQINDAAPLSHTLINWIDQVVVVVGRSYSSAPPCDNEPCFPKHSSNNMRFLQALLIYPILSANRVYHTPPPAPCDLECDILPTHSESGPSISFIVFEQRLWSRFRFRLVQRK